MRDEVKILTQEDLHPTITLENQVDDDEELLTHHQSATPIKECEEEDAELYMESVDASIESSPPEPICLEDLVRQGIDDL